MKRNVANAISISSPSLKQARRPSTATAIHGGASRAHRVKRESARLAPNLGVKARRARVAEHDVVRRVAADRRRSIVQRMRQTSPLVDE